MDTQQFIQKFEGMCGMTSSLHVSLPDEMRAFVDMRANGKSQYTTPSEYVRALIREDMAREEDRRYAIRSLLRAEGEFRRGEMLPLSALDAVDAELDEELR
jgi:antitoxin ParD1/3/4